MKLGNRVEPVSKYNKHPVCIYLYGQYKNFQIDFKTNPETSRKTINKWVAKQTKNRIDELFPSGSFTSMTRMAVTSAIYFQVSICVLP